MPTNLIGIAETFTRNISVIAKENDPQFKVTPVGFTRMLLENPVTYIIDEIRRTGSGHRHKLKLRYLKRGTESDVTERDDCTTPSKPIWGEAEVTQNHFAKIGLSLTDEEVRLWEEEGSRKIMIGSPQAPVSTSIYTSIITKLNGLFQVMNKNLLADQSANWGVNAVTGNNSPQMINFTNPPIAGDGIVKLIRDYEYNEMFGTPIIVGNGAVEDYNIMQSLKKGVDYEGYGSNTTFKVYGDINSTSVWGENHFGVFAPGMTGLVQFNKYVGGFANNTGSSIKFQLPVPVQLANGTLTALVLDAHLKNNPCNVYDENDKLIEEEGWGLILSKYYGLFNAPDDMFTEEDRLYGVNGSFHYVGGIKNGVQIAPADGAVFDVNSLGS